MRMPPVRVLGRLEVVEGDSSAVGSLGHRVPVLYDKRGPSTITAAYTSEAREEGSSELALVRGKRAPCRSAGADELTKRCGTPADSSVSCANVKESSGRDQIRAGEASETRSERKKRGRGGGGSPATIRRPAAQCARWPAENDLVCRLSEPDPCLAVSTRRLLLLDPSN